MPTRKCLGTNKTTFQSILGVSKRYGQCLQLRGFFFGGASLSLFVVTYFVSYVMFISQSCWLQVCLCLCFCSFVSSLSLHQVLGYSIPLNKTDISISSLSVVSLCAITQLSDPLSSILKLPWYLVTAARVIVMLMTSETVMMVMMVLLREGDVEGF